MKQDQRQFEFAIEVFVRGHSAVRSRTHPYDVDRVGPVWVMRDALRKNARDYRKEEWIASGVEPTELSRIAEGHTRGHYFLCDLLAEGMSDIELRDGYKALGYRLLATEGFFVHDLAREVFAHLIKSRAIKAGTRKSVVDIFFDQRVTSGRDLLFECKYLALDCAFFGLQVATHAGVQRGSFHIS